KVSAFYLDPEVILKDVFRNRGYQVIDARAVRSKDFKRFYFVQYKISTPNNVFVYPMFAMNKPTTSGGGNGVIFSMDDLALNLSGYGDGRNSNLTGTKFLSSDNGFATATGCLK
ncbi:hypothetical protein N9M53_05845, partial [Alphaproteobacteria bacterium]|nr:hypothetical protein [Alphaproteobacteria bacterium]